MATARELLEQADALMRRNRVSTLDDIPVLTDVMPAVAFSPAPRAAPPPADPGPPSVPLLTDNIDVMDDDATIGAEAVEGEPSAWLEFEDANPSVIGDAPDSIAIVPSVEMRSTPPDEALLASAEHEEIEFTLPAEEVPAEEMSAAEKTAADVVADEAAADEADALEGDTEEPYTADSALMVEARTAAAIEADADATAGADFAAVNETDAITAEWPDADAADAFEAGIADEARLERVVDVDAGETIREPLAAAPVAVPPVIVVAATLTPPAVPPSPVEAAGLAALEAGALAVAATVVQPPAVAPAPSMVDDDERWAAAAEEIRMQVLQRIDLFTDTGLRDQLTQRLQPIADRASADFVKAINLHVGDLLRTYVAEAIEREIERWRRDH